jgi:hypothetical protein
MLSLSILLQITHLAFRYLFHSRRYSFQPRGPFQGALSSWGLSCSVVITVVSNYSWLAGWHPQP